MPSARPVVVATCMTICILGLETTTEPCGAACIPLPTPAWRPLDHLAQAYPERGAAAAASELEKAAAAGDRLGRAQLYAVIAQARSDEGRTADAHAAVIASLAYLDHAIPPRLVDSLRARLAIADNINAESQSDLTSAVGALTEALGEFPAPSLERGCLLAARSEIYTEQLQLDSAASDATEAYALATPEHWPEVRAAASVALGALYRRSGLPLDAQRMYDEGLDYFRKLQAESQVLTLSYFRAQALGDQGREVEALAAFSEIRAGSRRIGDDMGAAIASLPMCDLLIKLGRITDAERECSAGLAQVKQYGRSDLEALVFGYQAEIDLIRHEPQAALAKYAVVFSGADQDLLPVDLARWYRGRSRALAALGRLPEALADLNRADDLERKRDLDQRARAALAVKAVAEAQHQAERERALQERVAAQDRELSSGATIRRLVGTVAALAAAVAAVLASFLWQSRRHARVVRRQEAILRSATANAPDALILLDRHWRVLYANRGLMGEPHPAAIGVPFLTTLQDPSRTTIERALRAVATDGVPRTIAATVRGAEGGDSAFEVWALPVVEGSRIDRFLLRSFNLTELRQLEREVAARSSTERDRLSADMHEGLSQELFGIAMLVTALAQSEGLDISETKDKLQRISLQLSRAVALTTELARGVSPVRTTRGMIGPALRRLGADVSARTGSDIVTQCPLEDRELPPLIADQVYQIAREGIAYAASCSKRVEVEYSEQSGSLVLTVKFASPPGSAARETPDEYVLAVMAHRATLIGGSLVDVTTEDGERLLTLSTPTTADESRYVQHATVAPAKP